MRRITVSFIRSSIPNSSAYNSAGVPYDVDLHSYIGAYSRIAYYLELQTATGLPNYIWVELILFTTNAAQLGVPAKSSSPIFQQYVTNMTVQSSVAGIVQGTGIATGNMEFWPWNYTQNNTDNIPNASSATFDWGDSVTSNSGNYGSMQLADSGASQMLFAFNNWGGNGGNIYIGIGNNTSTADADWTHVGNSTNYTVKTLQVFAMPVSNVAPVIVSATALSLTNVVVVFSKTLDNTSLALTNFTIAAATVLSSTLDPVTVARVSLVTTPLVPNTVYTTAVSNVRDHSPAALTIAPNSTATFLTPAVNGAAGNVPEAANYQLVYSISLPAAASYPNSAFYDVVRKTSLTSREWRTTSNYRQTTGP